MSLVIARHAGRNPKRVRRSVLRRGVACLSLGLAIAAASVFGSWACMIERPCPAVPSAARSGASVPTDLTHVERGELYVTGAVVADEFFRSVHELQVELDLAVTEERDARIALAKVLNLLPHAETSQILRKAQEVASQMPPMQLVIEEPDETGAQTVLAHRARPTDEAKVFMGALDATAQSELRIAMKTASLAERATRIRTVGTTLADGVSTDFAQAPAPRREEVKNELRASLAVLDKVGKGALTLREQVRSFVHDLADMLNEIKPSK